MEATAERAQETTAHDATPGAQPLKPALSPEEFYEATGRVLGLHSIYGKLAAKQIRSLRAGRKYLIPASEVAAFFEREAA